MGKRLEATLGATLALVLIGSVPCRAQGQDPAPKATPSVEPASAPDASPGLDPGSLEPREADARAALDLPKDRRTLSAFPKNLGRNFVGVFSGQNLFPFVVGAGATALSSAFDNPTERALKGSCTSCGTTGAALGGGAAMLPFVGAMFVAGRFAPEGHFRAASYDFMQALIVNGAYTELLKVAVQRPRPDGSDSLSFPSGHSSTAFALATVASTHYGWKIGVPAYALAAGIGLSRVEQDRHHLSDVIAGATLGFVVGRTVTRVDGEAAGRKRQLSITPATDAHGQGLGLGVSASW